MNKKIFSVIIILALLFLSMANVMAFMPKTHLWIWNKATANPINTDMYTGCIKYPDLCYSGNVLIDIGVYYYYTQGSKYQTTHSPSFCKLLLENAPKIPGHDPEKMKACAIGGCTHLPEDLASHGPNGLVQYSITHSFLVNSISHVFGEQHEDNIVDARDPNDQTQENNFLNGSTECQDLFVTSMLGTDAYKDMSKADLDKVYVDFVQEILSSQETGYNPAFREKSFLGTADSIPPTLLAGYFVIMSIFLLISVLLIIKIIKRQGKIRHWIGLILFLILFLIMAYFAFNMVQGTTFKAFINFIKPISNLVPIGNGDTYLNNAIQGTINLFQNGETTLEGTDPSGLGTNPILTNADKQIMWVDYIIFGVILIFFFWFIWYLFRKNKVVTRQQGFRL